jgi:hypothetical protein
LFGASVPFILRPQERGIARDSKLIGAVYLHGYMYGNVVAEWMVDKRRACVIKIH